MNYTKFETYIRKELKTGKAIIIIYENYVRYYYDSNHKITYYDTKVSFITGTSLDIFISHIWSDPSSLPRNIYFTPKTLIDNLMINPELVSDIIKEKYERFEI